MLEGSEVRPVRPGHSEAFALGVSLANEDLALGLPLLVELVDEPVRFLYPNSHRDLRLFVLLKPLKNGLADVLAAAGQLCVRRSYQPVRCFFATVWQKISSS